MDTQVRVTGDGKGPVDGDSQPSELAQASRTMVRLYKELFGRGPVKAWSEWAGANTLVCTLEETLTVAEQRMRDLGEHQRLRDVRMYFQYATLDEFVQPIEELTGRTVRSFISGIDTGADVAVELFIFHPRGSDLPSRTEMTEA